MTDKSGMNQIQNQVKSLGISPSKIAANKEPPASPSLYSTMQTVNYLQDEMKSLKSELERQKKINDDFQALQKEKEKEKEKQKEKEKEKEKEDTQSTIIENGGRSLHRGATAARAYAKQKADFASRAVAAARKAAEEADAIEAAERGNVGKY